MNNQNYQPNGYQPQSNYVYQDQALQRTLMQRVFVWMTFGLSITGLSSYLVYSSGFFYTVASSGMMWLLLIANVLLVMAISGLINRISFMTATGLFALYSLLNGVSLSVIFAAYTMESIATTFFITAGTFGAMALYGYITKRDLSKMGSILFMALIGLIIATLVNLLLKSSMLALITSGIGVLIFTGLTAYDVQSIKNMLSGATTDDEQVKKASLLGALSPYLDFINLFLYLLRFFGRKN